MGFGRSTSIGLKDFSLQPEPGGESLTQLIAASFLGPVL